VTALLLIAGVVQAHGQQLPCSTNPGPNCYNDKRPNNALAGCEHAKDMAKLQCYQKSSAPERQGCIDIANIRYTACVNNAIR
jgi:hypothetical protein